MAVLWEADPGVLSMMRDAWGTGAGIVVIAGSFLDLCVDRSVSSP